MRTPSNRRAFTLVELLVTIGIIAILIALLLPTLSRVQAQARSVKCMANLRQIVLGLTSYSTQNYGFIVPAFNLPFAPGATTNWTGGPQQPLDGWASILARDGFVPTSGEDQAPGQATYVASTDTVFYCPETLDIAGVSEGQTGTNQADPRGWADWPMVFPVVGGDSGLKLDTTIPERNFNQVFRIGYWFNAYNPIGGAVTNILQNDLYYSGSYGFGPDANGVYMGLHKVTNIRFLSRMIVVADGLYMGRQSVDQIGMTNCRIGYRHPGPKGQNTIANAGFADGHVESLSGSEFPCSFSKSSSYAGNNGTTTLSQQKGINESGPTVYANPVSALKLFETNNPTAQ
jgi:prepilin-type N-terminal cleavage/methylation domain-containing protein/prepilin-type processing-associated H-X9-DG protein